MQLKRDTDYAIRILFVIAESALGKKESQGMELKTICEKAAVPWRIALRLCGALTDAGFIKKEANKSTAYTSAHNLSEKTLLDIIEAVEGRSNLFAVFDRRTELYARYGHALELMNDVLSSELEKMTIQTILDCGVSGYASDG